MTHNYSKELSEIIVSMDDPLGKLDYLQAQLKDRIEELTEMRLEVLERADKLACAIDLNRKFEND